MNEASLKTIVERILEKGEKLAKKKKWPEEEISEESASGIFTRVVLGSFFLKVYYSEISGKIRQPV